MLKTLETEDLYGKVNVRISISSLMLSCLMIVSSQHMFWDVSGKYFYFTSKCNLKSHLCPSIPLPIFITFNVQQQSSYIKLNLPFCSANLHTIQQTMITLAQTTVVSSLTYFCKLQTAEQECKDRSGEQKLDTFVFSLD